MLPWHDVPRQHWAVPVQLAPAPPHDGTQLAAALHFAPQQSVSLAHESGRDVQEQETSTLLTSAPPTVPLPPATVHFPPAGWLRNVTLYVPPLWTVTGNVKPPLAVTVRVSVTLFARTKVPFSPETEPPILNEFVVHPIATLVTLAEPRPAIVSRAIRRPVR
jgi:hypothetical protein